MQIHTVDVRPWGTKHLIAAIFVAAAIVACLPAWARGRPAAPLDTIAECESRCEKISARCKNTPEVCHRLYVTCIGRCHENDRADSPAPLVTSCTTICGGQTEGTCCFECVCDTDPDPEARREHCGKWRELGCDRPSRVRSE